MRTPFPARRGLAVALLLTYVGVPGIYYGDEVGLGANPQASSRDCMPWERREWDLDLFEFYKKLVALRRTSPALREGGFQVLWVEEDLLAYLRDAEQELVIVIGNRGPGLHPPGALPVRHGAIPDGLTFTEIFSEARATVVNGCLPLATLPPGVQVWRAQP